MAASMWKNLSNIWKKKRSPNVENLRTSSPICIDSDEQREIELTVANSPLKVRQVQSYDLSTSPDSYDLDGESLNSSNLSISLQNPFSHRFLYYFTRVIDSSLPNFKSH